MGLNKIIQIGIGVLFLASCDVLKKPASTPESTDLPTISGVHLVCGDNCIPQVAGLFNPYDPQGAGYCTATLVGNFGGKPVLATNKHCVMGARDNGDCHEMIAEFPATAGHGQVGVRCAKIIAQSTDDLDPQAQDFTGKDYAFFTVDRPVNRPALKMSRQGVADGAVLSVPYLDITQKDALILRRQTCHAAMHSLVNLSYDDPARRILSLFGCGIPASGAGAPVLDANGHFVALIFEGENSDFMSSHAEAKRGADAFVHQRLAYRNFALRLGCLDVPELGLRIDDLKHCERVTRLSSEEDIHAASNEHDVINEERSILEHLNKASPANIFEFELVPVRDESVTLAPNQDLKSVEVARPKCFVTPITTWISPFKKEYLGGLSANYDGSATLHVETLLLYTYFELDDDLHVQTKVGQRILPQEIKFSPYQLTREGVSNISTTTLGEDRVEYATIPICPSKN